MDILMIGNGFDLEHELPTKYTDFLKFVKKFKIVYNIKRKGYAKTLYKTDIDNIEYFELIFSDSKFENRVIALNNFIEENLWINYFDKTYKKRLTTKGNWIDFECEIKNIIHSLDDLIKYYESVKEGSNDENKSIETNYKSILSVIFPTTKYSLNYEFLKSYISILLKDLNNLIGALEIYIWDYVGNIKIEYYNPDIVKVNADKVFSFNYSNTYKNLYAFQRKNIEYSFVHGMAKNNITFFTEIKEGLIEEIEKCVHMYAEKNNIVLGIDEYLPKNRSSKEIDFIAFKKYYQRIYKKTGNEYKNWLREIDQNLESTKKENNTLHIFGHSLDVTDGDILREFINHKNIKTIVYYRNKEQLGQQIANLVKILKSDTVIEKVYGSNPCINFVLQSKRELICESDLEIQSDTLQFETFHNLDNTNAKSLIEKINDRITDKDLKYFHSQKSVISLFDVLQRIGLAKLYKKKLLEIASELVKCKDLLEPEQYDWENWSYVDYNNSYNCDLLTQKFVDYINIYNKKNFMPDDSCILSNDEQLSEWEKLIKSGEKIDKENYIEIISLIFYMFQEQKNIKNLWNLLKRISRGPAEKVAKNALKELIEQSDDEINIIRYNHLQREIEIDEYFDMKQEEFEEYFVN